MKLSVSLPAEDVEFLDRYVATNRIRSRSAAVHRAVVLLRSTEPGPAYEQAWTESASHDGSELWETTAGGGLS